MGSQEDALQILGLQSLVAEKVALRRYNLLRTEYNVRLRDAARRGVPIEPAAQASYLDRLKSAFNLLYPEAPLPDEWIVGPWGAWGPWANNTRERRRVVHAQGTPRMEEKPQEIDIEEREPRRPFSLVVRDAMADRVRNAPPFFLFVSLAWLLAMHVLAVLYCVQPRKSPIQEIQDHPSLYYSPIHDRLAVRSFGRRIDRITLSSTSGPYLIDEMSLDNLSSSDQSGMIDMSAVDTGLYLFQVEFHDSTRLEQLVRVHR